MPAADGRGDCVVAAENPIAFWPRFTARLLHAGLRMIQSPFAK